MPEELDKEKTKPKFDIVEDILDNSERECGNDELLFHHSDTSAEKVLRTKAIDNNSENLLVTETDATDRKVCSYSYGNEIDLKRRHISGSNSSEVVHNGSEIEVIPQNLAKDTVEKSRTVHAVETFQTEPIVEKTFESESDESKISEIDSKSEKSLLANISDTHEIELEPNSKENESSRQKEIVKSEISGIVTRESIEVETVTDVESSNKQRRIPDKTEESSYKEKDTFILINKTNEETVTEGPASSVPNQLNDTSTNEYNVTVDRSDRKYIEIAAEEKNNMGNSQSKESDLESSEQDNDSSTFSLEYEDLQHTTRERQNENGAERILSESNGMSSVSSATLDSDFSVNSSLSSSDDIELSKHIQEYRPRLGSAERNVFDAFPVDIPASSENSTTTESESENSDSTCEQACSQTENAKTDLQNNVPEGSVKTASDFLSSFEKFLQNQSPDEKSDSASTKSEEIVQDIPACQEICKTNRRPIFKTIARSQKLRKGSSSKETAAKESTSDSDESDVFMKAKQKYQCFKELRVSLNAKDINSNTQVVGKPSKTLKRKFIAKSKLSKNNAANHTEESESEDLLREELLASGGENLKLDTFKSPVNTSLEESTKPLKKRGRRGDSDIIQKEELTESQIIESSNADEDRSETSSEMSHVKEITSDIDLLSDEKQTLTDKLASNTLIKKSCLDNPAGPEGEQAVEKAALDRLKNCKTSVKRKSKSSAKLSTLDTREHSVLDKVKPERKKETDSHLKDNFRCPNADSIPRKCDKISTVIKKYPERSCKLRLMVSESKVNKKDDSKCKVSATLKKSSDNSQILKTSDSITKKKKRKRKVKPWSWGNEKKRYKPKPKLDSETSNNTESNRSNIGHETKKAELSENKLSDSELSEASNLNIQSKEVITNTDHESVTINITEADSQHVTEEESTEFEENSVIEAKTRNCISKKQRRRGKGRRGSQKKTEKSSVRHLVNAEKDSDYHEIPFYQDDKPKENHYITNSFQFEANDNELHDENFPPNVSPDSGIQSLTGSPAGHESPNQALNQQCSITTNSSLIISTLTSNQIIDSKNGIVSSVLCAAASASLSSTSVTTSVISSTETVSVFSKSVPISSVTATASFHPLPLCDMLTSSTNFIAIPVLDSQINGTHLNSNNLDLAKDACSKKKNRAKFLQRHKASTLLQKGRLPTEEEKEQRLEDKFDYLSKVGAKPVFDESEVLDTNVDANESYNCNFENFESIVGIDNKFCSENLNKSVERTETSTSLKETENNELNCKTKEYKENDKHWMCKKASKVDKKSKKSKPCPQVDTSNSHIKEHIQINVDQDDSLFVEAKMCIENGLSNEEKVTDFTKNKKRGRKKKVFQSRQKNDAALSNETVQMNTEENIQSDHNVQKNEANQDQNTTNGALIDLGSHGLGNEGNKDGDNTEDPISEDTPVCVSVENNMRTDNLNKNQVNENHEELTEMTDLESIKSVKDTHFKRKGRTKRKRGRSKGTSSDRKNMNTHRSELDTESVGHVNVPTAHMPVSSSEPVSCLPTINGVYDSVLNSENVTQDICYLDLQQKKLSKPDSECENAKNNESSIVGNSEQICVTKKDVEIDIDAGTLSLNEENALQTDLKVPAPEATIIKRKRGRPAKKKKAIHLQGMQTLQNNKTNLINKLVTPPNDPHSNKPAPFKSPSFRSSPYKYHPTRPPAFKFLSGRSQPYKPFSVKSPIYKSIPSKTIQYKTLSCKSPPYKQKYQELITKRKRGRPKGSKNKVKIGNISNQDSVQQTVIQQTVSRPVGRPPLARKRPRGRPKGSLNKVKKTSMFPQKSGNQTDTNNPDSSEPMMQWRESKIIPEGEEKKKRRGRPPKKSQAVDQDKRKNSSKVQDIPKKIGADSHAQNSSAKDSLASLGQALPMSSPERNDLPLGSDEWFSDHCSGFVKDRIKRKKTSIDQKSKSYLEQGERILQPPRMCQEQEPDVGIDLSGREPAQSVSSLDSDTSGGGSSLSVKTSAIQMWMEISKHRKKKNKKKLLHFRSKHKNIIDPVFNAEVDYLTNMIPRLSISPRGETYLKVRPGEMPLPSIFRIARIDVKKKKKDKLFVFEKAKPLKPKNDAELSTRDKIRLGRKICMLSENFLDPDDLNSLKQCNLPPKKRLKLFSTMSTDEESLSDGHPKPEKRKGRPRKTQPAAAPQTKLTFGKLIVFDENFLKDL